MLSLTATVEIGSSRAPLPHPTSDYALSLCTNTDSTVSGLPGPGRVVGNLLSSAGKRVETVLDRFAERLGRGPNMAALRLTTGLLEMHTCTSGSSSESSHYISSRRASVDSLNKSGLGYETAPMYYELMRVCNGVCSECDRPFVPHILQDVSENLWRTLTQLLSYLCNAEISNVELAATYIHILVYSHVFALRLTRAIHPVLLASITRLDRQFWPYRLRVSNTLALLNDCAAIIDSEYSSIWSKSFIWSNNLTRCQCAEVFELKGRIDQFMLMAEREMSQDAELYIALSKLCTFVITNDFDASGSYSEQSAKSSLLLSSLESYTLLPNLPEFIMDLLIKAISHIARVLVDRHAKVLIGHDDQVNAVTISPDGELVASGSSDCTVRLWSTATGQLTAILDHHTMRVNAVAFSPHGTYLASASDDTTVMEWDIHGSDYTSRATYSGRGAWATAATYCPQEGYLTCGFVDGSVDRHTGYFPEWHGGSTSRRSSCCKGTTNHWVRALAFSPDGSRLAVASLDKISVMDCEEPNGTQVACLHHDTFVNCVTFSIDGLHVIAGVQDGTIQIWNVKFGYRAKILAGHEGSVQSIALSPDGSWLASASADHTVRLWCMISHRVIAILKGHTGIVNSVAFLSDGRQLVSGSSDRTIRLMGVHFILNSHLLRKSSEILEIGGAPAQ